MQANRTLIDQFGRKVDYIRLSITDRCDFRCVYCMAEDMTFLPRDEVLSLEECARLVKVFVGLGVSKVRITGGEPLVRKDMPLLAARLARLPGIDDLSLSTNAVQLAKHARALKDAGVTRLNVSLDSLQPERFQTITGGKLEKVLAGLQAAKEAGFHPIKINMVVMKDVNDDEVEDLVEYCIANDFTLRMIETMPMGETGRDAARHYMDLQVIKQRLAQRYELIPTVMSGGGPARYFKVGGSNLRIGFITPISQHFCATCNRVRLSVDGTLYMCLGQEHNFELRPLLRAGISDADLRAAIIKAIALKPERHEFSDKPEKILRFMSKTGG